MMTKAQFRVQASDHRVAVLFSQRGAADVGPLARKAGQGFRAVQARPVRAPLGQRQTPQPDRFAVLYARTRAGLRGQVAEAERVDLLRLHLDAISVRRRRQRILPAWLGRPQRRAEFGGVMVQRVLRVFR